MRDDLLSMAPRIYEAAQDRALWPDVLERFGAVIGAPCGALIRQDFRTGEGHSVAYNIEAAAMADLVSNAQRNVLLARIGRAAAGTVATDQDCLPKDEFRRTSYYSDFLAPRMGVNAVMMGVLWRGASDVVAVNFGRELAQAEFGDFETEALRALAPHFERALLLSLRLDALEAADTRHAVRLDRAALGVLTLDARGKVVHANRLAELLLSEGDALSVGPGGLRAATHAATMALQALVGRAAGGADGGAVALPRPGAARPLYALVAPFNRDHGWLGASRGRVIVLVRDPATYAPLPETVLQDLFALTASEARLVARLHRIGSLAGAAVDLNIRPNTARVHLNAALRKTGVHGQAELQRLLASVSDMLRHAQDRSN